MGVGRGLVEERCAWCGDAAVGEKGERNERMWEISREGPLSVQMCIIIESTRTR
jgi:hypothetical protein